MTSKVTRNVTSSPASASGPQLSAVPDGPMSVKYGPDRVPASPSRRLGSAAAKPTRDIFGRSSTGLSPSAGPELSSVNKSRRPRSLVVLEKDRAYQMKYRKNNRAKDLIRHARERATKKGVPFNLDSYVLNIQQRINHGTCEVTGLPFNLEGGRTWDSPSLDRIESSAGYLHSNIRVVCHAVNSAMGDWGEQKMVELALGVLAKRRQRSNELSKQLAENLRRRTAALGSTLFKLTWKELVTPSGRSIYRLRASGRRTSGSDCGSWPTARASDDEKNVRTLEGSLREIERKGGPQDLNQAACLASWPTPTKGNADGSQMGKDASATGRRPDGSKATVSLNQVATLASWPTPAAHEPGGTPEEQQHRFDRARAKGIKIDNTKPTGLSLVAQLANWPTPTVHDAERGGQAKRAHGPDRHGSNLQDFALLARSTASGETPAGFPAPTEKRGQLRAGHSRWLMGIETAWDDCAPTATRSTAKRRSSSSAPLRKRSTSTSALNELLV